ncbi:MAG: hypothetical protein IKZ61_07915 [Prevotella sp.]|nr:hypothetical protein [Prevotella sp.]
MRKLLSIILPHIGMASVYLGTLLLVVSFLLGWTSSNFVLFLSLFLIIAGVIAHVVILKQNHQY